MYHTNQKSRFLQDEICVIIGFALFSYADTFARPMLGNLSAYLDVYLSAAKLVIPGLLLACLVFNKSITKSSKPKQISAAIFIIGCSCVLISECCVFFVLDLLGISAAYICTICNGFGFALLSIIWIVQISHFSARRNYLLFIAGYGIGKILAIPTFIMANSQLFSILGYGFADVSFVLQALILIRARKTAVSRTSSCETMSKASHDDCAAPSNPRLLPGECLAYMRSNAPVLLGVALFSFVLGLTTMLHNNSQLFTVIPDAVSSVLTIALLIVLCVFERRRQGEDYETRKADAFFLIVIPLLATIEVAVPLLFNGFTDVVDIAAKLFGNLCTVVLLVNLLRCNAADTNEIRSLCFTLLSFGFLWLGAFIGTLLGLVLVNFTVLDHIVVTGVALIVIWGCVVYCIFINRAQARRLVAEAEKQTEIVYVSSDEKLVEALSHVDTFSQREKDVILLLMQGMSNARIAEKLYISENTVKTHLQHIYAKAGVSNRQDLLELVRTQVSDE